MKTSSQRTEKFLSGRRSKRQLWRHPSRSHAITIFLKHDQSKPLEQINAQLHQQGFYKAFPPPGIEVVSWYVMMGIGQVVTLRVPAEHLRGVNRAIEETAWGGFRTEFYATYGLRSHR
jgi:hypothetical protein